MKNIHLSVELGFIYNGTENQASQWRMNNNKAFQSITTILMITPKIPKRFFLSRNDMPPSIFPVIPAIIAKERIIVNGIVLSTLANPIKVKFNTIVMMINTILMMNDC